MLDGPTFPDDWPRRPIYELARWTNGLAFRDFQFSDSGWPVIKIAELKEGVTGQTKFTRQTFDERHHVKNGDMLLSWSGNPETSLDVFWWRRGDGWLNQHIFKVEPTDIHPGFFYYLLRYLRPTFGEIAANKQTTGLGHVTAGDLRSLLVGVPPVRVQQNIAYVLGSLDDKIELNCRMNQTLEEICRALFKFWFVDFGPVRAKAEGRWKKGESLPGMPADMWDLWPSEFEESEIGEIPNGWTVRGLLDVASLHSGGTPTTSEPSYWGGGIPWVSGKDVSSAKGSFLLRTERTVSDKGIAHSHTSPLPARTVVITARGTVGALAILAEPMCISQTNYGLKAANGVPDNFLRFAVEGAVEGLRQESYGTIFDTITTKNLSATQVVLPTPQVLASFANRTDPLMSAVLLNLRLIETLAEARDTLLPKLFSGEIRFMVDS